MPTPIEDKIADTRLRIESSRRVIPILGDAYEGSTLKAQLEFDEANLKNLVSIKASLDTLDSYPGGKLYKLAARGVRTSLLLYVDAWEWVRAVTGKRR